MSKDDGRVVSNFVCQSLMNESITIFGEGNQTRSFCYVDDLIDGLIKIMNSNNKVLALKYRPQTFNELVGQKVIGESIYNSIKNNKMLSEDWVYENM